MGVWSVESRKGPRIGAQFEGEAVFAVVVFLLLLLLILVVAEVVVSAGFLKIGQETEMDRETYVVGALIQLDMLVVLLHGH